MCVMIRDMTHVCHDVGAGLPAVPARLQLCILSRREFRARRAPGGDERDSDSEREKRQRQRQRQR